MAANFLLDNDDLLYYLNEGIDWEPIVRVTEMDFRTAEGFKNAGEAVEFYKEIAQMVGEFVAEEVAPHAAAIDREGIIFENGDARFPPTLDGIFKKIGALDLHGMCLPRELGGMNAPMLLYFINTEIFARADVSTMAHFGFHGGIAMAMLMYSVLEGTTKVDPETGRILETRFRKEIEEIAQGKAWGSMDITEPDAGSDMAALRCVGQQDEDGNWTITGQKIFITSGHGKYHFVIARTEKAGDPDGGAASARGRPSDDPFAGLGGLSFFLVPIYQEKDGEKKWLATIDRVEEKLGHHGSVTAAITFENTPAQLIGNRGDGFKYMLMLMNNARLGVGFESIGCCEAALRLARDYAAERASMGKTIDRHEMIADYLDEMESDIQGLRAMAMWGAIHEEIGQKLNLVLVQQPPQDAAERKSMERLVKSHRKKARRVTPLLKYLASEKAVEMARRCVQIHGGNGYMKEYGAEKLLRDSIVFPIYEGTSQIQALMAMKDTLMGIMKNPRGFVTRVAQTRWRALSARDALERRVAKIQQLSLGAQQHLMMKTAADKFRSLSDKPFSEWPTAFFKNWNPKRDFAYAMLHAERLTRLLADEIICEILLEQAKRHPHRREVLERYLERAEPRCRYLHDEITTTGQGLLSRLAALDAGDEEREKKAG